jgi:uncharacterized protein (TIGR02246 family)
MILFENAEVIMIGDFYRNCGKRGSQQMISPTAIINQTLRWLFLLCWTSLLFAQADEIRTLLKNSEAAWNRGDLAAFASDYEDSPETTFIGREVTRGGTQAILERYRRSYPNREAMGKLAFSEIEIRTLAAGVMLATGKYELKRTVAAGGDTSGRFTLILRKSAAGWKIIHDHSS